MMRKEEQSKDDENREGERERQTNKQTEKKDTKKINQKKVVTLKYIRKEGNQKATKSGGERKRRFWEDNSR